jgi:hypothetical protein
VNLSVNQCQRLIQLAEDIPKSEWRSIDTLNHASYDTVQVSAPDDIKYVIENYCKDSLDLELKNINVGVIRYKKGDKFSRHNDYSENKFLYNLNVRLNDDFEGGQFYLNDEIFDKPIGEIYHYKSTIYHEVKEITNGVRYLALFYIKEIDIKNKKETLI